MPYYFKRHAVTGFHLLTCSRQTPVTSLRVAEALKLIASQEVIIMFTSLLHDL